jgi:starch synthase
MACSKAVVATRVGGIVDAIQDGVTGRLVPNGSVQALANACVAFAEQPETARVMGCAARKTAETTYQMAEGVHQYVQLYEQIAEHQ